jgi:hypothetical protein
VPHGPAHPRDCRGSKEWSKGCSTNQAFGVSLRRPRTSRAMLSTSVSCPFVGVCFLAVLAARPPAWAARFGGILARNPLTGAQFTAVTHPLSVLNDPLVHTGHHTHDGGSARAGQTLGSACLIKMVNSAWRGTYGGCEVGQDGQGLLRTLHRQVRRLLASCRFSKP